MKADKGQITEQGADGFVRLFHLGLILFGIAAWLTGDAADDYKKYEHFWFTIHGWIGMGLASTIAFYVLYRVLGPKEGRIFGWIPYTIERLRMAGQDIRGLLRLRMPDRPAHQGLAGMVQFFGVLVFLGMAVTGALMFTLLEPGSKARGLVHAIKEVHEAGEVLIPLYLSIHIGAVVLHSIAGRPVWRRIFLSGKAE